MLTCYRARRCAWGCSPCLILQRGPRTGQWCKEPWLLGCFLLFLFSGQIFTRGRAISCLGIAIWYFVGTLSLHYTKLLGIGRAPLAGWICWGDVSVPSCTRRAGKVADARRKLVKKITTGIGFALAACQDITWAAFASLPILLPAPVVEVRHQGAAGAASKLFALQGFPREGVSIARGHRLLSSNPLGDEVAGGEQSSKITQRAEGAASPRILPCDVCEVCCGQV